MNNYFSPAYESTNWDTIFNNDNITLPLTPPTIKKDSGYYHYTTLSAAEKILNLNLESDDKIGKGKTPKHSNQNSYITLYASHFLFLNDGEELFQGIEKIKPIFKKKLQTGQALPENVKTALNNYKDAISNLKPNNIENAPNHFILCFCSDGNLLSQWEWYGKNCGIAIEFDLNNCVIEGFSVRKEKMQIVPNKINVYEIMYTDEQKKIAIDKLQKYDVSSRIKADRFAMLSLAVASHMKHPGFINEKEIRLLLAPLYQEGLSYNDALRQIKYREIDGILKPYMEVHIKHKESKKSPIKSVTVGPGHNQSLVYSAVQKLVQTRFANNTKNIEPPQKNKTMFYEYTKIGDIEVRRSTIPFRG